MRKFIILLLAMVLCLSFSACGSKEAEPVDLIDINMVFEELDGETKKNYIENEELINIFLDNFGNSTECIGITKKDFDVEEGNFDSYDIYVISGAYGPTDVYLVPSTEDNAVYIYKYNTDGTLTLSWSEK